MKKTQYFKNDHDYDEVIVVFVGRFITHNTHDTLKTQINADLIYEVVSQVGQPTVMLTINK